MKSMKPLTIYIVIGAWILSIALALVSAGMYPINQMDPWGILMWEAIVITWISLLMALIYKKSLPGQ